MCGDGAARPPHIPGRCLVGLVRAEAAKGGAGTMTTQSGPGPGRPDRSPSASMGERRQLINLAYRLLGSLAEAEDAVQETYARWYAMSAPQRDAIESPGAWLTTVATRICLNLLGSARGRAAPRPTRPTRPTGSPWTSRSAWPSWWCSTR